MICLRECVRERERERERERHGERETWRDVFDICKKEVEREGKTCGPEERDFWYIVCVCIVDSVTRWLDYLFSIGKFTAMKISPRAYKI